MPNILRFPIDRAIKITPQQNGQYGEFGPAGVASTVGVWMVQWVPDSTFTGGLAIIGRSPGQKAVDNDVPFSPIPYQVLNLNGAVPTLPYAFTSAVIDGPSIIQIPSNQLSVAIEIACSAGFGWLYSWDVNGTANSQ